MKFHLTQSLPRLILSSSSVRPRGIESSSSHLHSQKGKTYEELKQEMGEDGIKKVSEIRITTQVSSQWQNNNRFFSLFRFFTCSVILQFRTPLIPKLNISIPYSDYHIPFLVSVLRIWMYIKTGLFDGLYLSFTC